MFTEPESALVSERRKKHCRDVKQKRNKTNRTRILYVCQHESTSLGREVKRTNFSKEIQNTRAKRGCLAKCLIFDDRRSKFSLLKLLGPENHLQEISVPPCVLRQLGMKGCGQNPPLAEGDSDRVFLLAQSQRGQHLHRWVLDLDHCWSADKNAPEVLLCGVRVTEEAGMVQRDVCLEAVNLTSEVVPGHYCVGHSQLWTHWKMKSFHRQ